MPRRILIRVTPVLGSIILFLSWAFQQTLLEDANSTLQRIYNAESVYQTYQSNNAIFNAIIVIADSDTASIDKIRRSQIYNYELGLKDMVQLLDDEAKADIPGSPSPFSGTPDVDVMMATTQERLEKIQGELADQKDEIINRKSTFNKIFLLLYAFGSAIVLVGSVFNVLISSETGETDP